MDKLVIKPGERVSHAYIVASASEEARRETAQRLAAAMLCESGGDRPCGECRHCRKVFAGIHPDVISVAPGVDDKGRKRRSMSASFSLRVRKASTAQRLGVPCMTLR